MELIQQEMKRVEREMEVLRKEFSAKAQEVFNAPATVEGPRILSVACFARLSKVLRPNLPPLIPKPRFLLR